MSYIVVIPARYKSTRFPGKPLVDIAGKSMLFRTYEQCVQAVPAELVYVATEDERIVEHCALLGMNCILTSDHCLTGTDRLAEVSQQIVVDHYINVQGDEPLFNPADIQLLLQAIKNYPNDIINGFCAIHSKLDYESTSIPKVVMRPDGRLLYMSRNPIPGNKEKLFQQAWRQVCAYAFPYASLQQFSSLKEKLPLEKAEDIEILRFLELGYEVRMIAMSDVSVAVDHLSDVDKVLSVLKKSHHNENYST